MDLLGVPKEWMPDADMMRVHSHWTAGTNNASTTDLRHYHFLIEGDGTILRGNHSVSRNMPPLTSGKYAAHSYRSNSNAIGIGVCGMRGATDRPLRPGKYPINEVQWKKLIALNALLATRYKIEVTSKTILSHAEIEANLGISQRGKWDIAWLPFKDDIVSASVVGGLLRKEVSLLV
jgi:N-acetyl-anhydromuramyl-L-alanine amidase AmpD